MSAIKTKVFLSWSGSRSKKIALALRAWLPKVLQNAEPFVSEKDIDVGKRWSEEVARELEESAFGIICVTPENQTAPWLLFEAGALAKHAKLAKVVPYLHGGLEFAHLASSPLSAFHGAKQSDPEGTFSVVKSLNNELIIPLPDDALREAFDVWWPKLLDQLKAADEAGPELVPNAPTIQQQVAEVLGAVLGLSDDIRAVGQLGAVWAAAVQDPLSRELMDLLTHYARRPRKVITIYEHRALKFLRLAKAARLNRARTLTLPTLTSPGGSEKPGT